MYCRRIGTSKRAWNILFLHSFVKEVFLTSSSSEPGHYTSEPVNKVQASLLIYLSSFYRHLLIHHIILITLFYSHSTPYMICILLQDYTEKHRSLYYAMVHFYLSIFQFHSIHFVISYILVFSSILIVLNLVIILPMALHILLTV